MPTPWQRDLEADGAKFVAWLREKLPAAKDLEVSPLVQPESSGFSNETLLFDLSFSDAGRHHSESLVIRVEPVGYRVFPEYDLHRQYRIMELLAPTDVPVPRMRWFEEDPAIFGAPFFVMERVEGRVPEDRPPYHTGGWMTEISPEERRAIWLGGFEAMAKIHRLDPGPFEFLRKPGDGSGLERELAYYERYLEWAARGLEQPIALAALEWLKKNLPAGEPETLVWGDARIGNVIFDGTKVASVLDWEMAALASPEMDIGWAVFLDRHHSESMGVPRLEGFPSFEESIAFYEEMSGHKVRHLFFYQVFTGFRFTVIMARIAQQMVHYGVMDEAAGRRMELDNTVTRLTAKLLDLPPPNES